MIKKLIDKLKNKRVGITVIILMFIGFSFYWYEWRPYLIKKNCFVYAVEIVTDSAKDNTAWTQVKAKEDLDFWYKICLKRKGL